MKFSSMNSLREQLSSLLERADDVAFAYLYGSSAHRNELKPGSDTDIAVYFLSKPDIDRVYELMKSLEKLLDKQTLDLLVLNDCEDYILLNEVLKGELISCRNQDIHASFFSWTLRMYEDEMMHARVTLPFSSRDPAL